MEWEEGTWRSVEVNPEAEGEGEIVATAFIVVSAGGNGQVRQGKQVGIISAGFGV